MADLDPLPSPSHEVLICVQHLEAQAFDVYISYCQVAGIYVGRNLKVDVESSLDDKLNLGDESCCLALAWIKNLSDNFYERRVRCRPRSCAMILRDACRLCWYVRPMQESLNCL